MVNRDSHTPPEQVNSQRGALPQAEAPIDDGANTASVGANDEAGRETSDGKIRWLGAALEKHVAAMKNRVRSWLLAILSPRTIVRITFDLGSAVGIAFGIGYAMANPFVLSGISLLLGALCATLIAAAYTGGFIELLLKGLVAVMGNLSHVSVSLRARSIPFHKAMARYAAAVARYAAAVTFYVVVTVLLITHLFDLMPVPTNWLAGVLLLVFGTWACMLTQRRVRTSRHIWVRYATDLLVIALIVLDLLVLFNRDLFTTKPAAGLLFPFGVWLSIQAWRAMTSSRRFEVRAGADIVLSLFLGANLVLFLVWAANLLDLPEAEVAVLRGTLERVGSIAEVPWQLWVGLYILLAGMSLAFAAWPATLAMIIQWFQRYPVVRSIDLSRRALSGLHISLLVTVLIALAEPASLEATLRGPLKAKYTVALQRELESHGEQAAYEEIRRHFTTSTSALVSGMQSLVETVRKIHRVSSPAPGDGNATSTEQDLARRLGQVQAITLQLTAMQSPLSAPQAANDLAQFTPPIHDANDLKDRLDQLDTQQRRADTRTQQVDQAAELATVAVANMLQIPNLGENEIIQIIREYLSGVIESSPLKKVFATWAEHLTNTTPPRADTMVIPDPKQLEQAALTYELEHGADAGRGGTQAARATARVPQART
jgi:hypothetical protein